MRLKIISFGSCGTRTNCAEIHKMHIGIDCNYDMCAVARAHLPNVGSAACNLSRSSECMKVALCEFRFPPCFRSERLHSRAPNWAARSANSNCKLKCCTVQMAQMTEHWRYSCISAADLSSQLYKKRKPAVLHEWNMLDCEIK